jgi:DNA-directed RNA polymerase subunit RPC12/RpoP
MSLKCSVLGHRFDETSVERERHEEGTEVIITITEVESCSRCGESRIVSENKEVTTMETPDDADTPGAATADAPGDGDRDEDDGAAESADVPERGDDAEIIDAGSEPESTAQATARTETAIPDAEEGTAEDDDGVIVDSGDSASGAAAPDDADSPTGSPDPDDTGAAERGSDGSAREPGSWPDEPESDPGRPEEAADWPGDDARSSDDTVTAGADGGSIEWPDDGDREDAGVAPEGPDLEPVEGPTVTAPEGMFKCSECGFTTEVEASSLRAGDFCPECHRGTLVQESDTPSPD